jgi:hypothetical protein
VEQQQGSKFDKNLIVVAAMTTTMTTESDAHTWRIASFIAPFFKPVPSTTDFS